MDSVLLSEVVADIRERRALNRVREAYLEEGMEKGMEKGIEKTIEALTRIRMGLPADQIARETGLSMRMLDSLRQFADFKQASVNSSLEGISLEENIE